MTVSSTANSHWCRRDLSAPANAQVEYLKLCADIGPVLHPTAEMAAVAIDETVILLISIDTPTKGRGGVQQNNSLVTTAQAAGMKAYRASVGLDLYGLCTNGWPLMYVSTEQLKPAAMQVRAPSRPKRRDIDCHLIPPPCPLYL